MELGIYCPYPMWAEEESKSFYPDSADKGEIYNFLDYPYDYQYDYSKPLSGTEHWYVDHYRSSNFQMTIYGPCANPRIIIVGQVYQVYDTLEAHEYIVIDSRKKTIIKRLANGTEQNIFYKKATGNSIFTEIPSGDILINWEWRVWLRHCGVQRKECTGMDLIKTDQYGRQIGYVQGANIDFEVGTDEADSINDFEIELKRWNWDGSIRYGTRVFSPDTEYGGIVREISTDTSTNVIRAKGDTWRGMMTKKLYSH